jgi:transposase
VVISPFGPLSSRLAGDPAHARLFLAQRAQFERSKPYFLLSYGVPRVDDRRVVSGIIHVIRNGLRWRDAPEGYGPHKTLYNRSARWSRMGVFAGIFSNLVADDEPPDCLMIDSTHLKAHRCRQSTKWGDVPRRIGRTKGGLNSKLHAVCDGTGRPIIFLLTEGQMRTTRARRLSTRSCRPRVYHRQRERNLSPPDRLTPTGP